MMAAIAVAEEAEAAAAAVVPAAAAAAAVAEDEDPDWMNCPITTEPIVDPVRLATTDYHYERDAITTWLTAHGTCPMTRALVAPRGLLEAAPAFRTRLAAYWDAVADDASASGGGGEEEEDGGVALAAAVGAAVGTAVTGAAAVGAAAAGAAAVGAAAGGGPAPPRAPFRSKRCQQGAACPYLRSARGCDFKHTAAEVNAARSGHLPGAWTCRACAFVNRAANASCGGAPPPQGATQLHFRRFGCGRPKP